MKKLHLFIFFLLFSCICYSQLTLQYDLKKGDIFEIKQHAEQVISQELDGAAHEIINDISGILSFEVIGEKEDNYEIYLSFKDLNLKMSSSIQGELMNVNAKELKEGDIQSKVFNSLLNTRVKLILAKTGNIIEVIGGDSLVNKMAAASGLEDEFSLNMMKNSLKNEFGSEALSHSYEQMTYIYPNKKIAVGDKWENQYSGKLIAKNTWTLSDLNTESAKISGAASVAMDVKEPTTTMELNGTQETKVTTDRNSGFIKKMDVKGVFKGFSTIAQMGTQEIPTTITSTITYELINQ